MSNSTKEKIYFAVITNLATIAIFLIVPLFLERDLLYDWYHKKSMILYSHPLLTSLVIIVGLVIFVVFIKQVWRMLIPFMSKHNVDNRTNKLSNEHTPEEQDNCVNVPMSFGKIEDIIQKRKIEQERIQVDKMEHIKRYVKDELCIYMKEEELFNLIENICQWSLEKGFILTPVVTDGRLSSLDLRHLIWNIGKRLSWTGHQCATFVKVCFPLEMNDLEIESIRRNLRQKGPCIIQLDIPETGSYAFHSTHS